MVERRQAAGVTDGVYVFLDGFHHGGAEQRRHQPVEAVGVDVNRLLLEPGGDFLTADEQEAFFGAEDSIQSGRLGEIVVIAELQPSPVNLDLNLDPDASFHCGQDLRCARTWT